MTQLYAQKACSSDELSGEQACFGGSDGGGYSVISKGMSVTWPPSMKTLSV